MINRDFSMPNVDAKRDQIQKICDDLIDAMIAKGPLAELIQDYAFALPTTLICHILGIPLDRRDFLELHVATMFNRNTPLKVAEESGDAVVSYLRELIDEAAGQDEKDEIISRLVHRQYIPGNIEMPDLINTLLQLIAGGFDTTGNGIGSGIHLLLQHLDQLAALRDSEDPEFVASAVEELLRFIPIIDTGFDRVAIEDIDMDGHLIRAGEGLVFNIPTANRDPRDFENAADVDICGRDVSNHLAFGAGPHQCIGQNLARAELQIAIHTLLRRLPGLDHAIPVGEIEWRFDRLIVGVDALPITWDQEAAAMLRAH